MINRTKLRGKPLDEFCMSARTTTNEYGVNDDRVFCYGFLNSRTEELLDECKVCKAHVNKAEPIYEEVAE